MIGGVEEEGISACRLFVCKCSKFSNYETCRLHAMHDDDRATILIFVELRITREEFHHTISSFSGLF